jgi:glycosyltransferase involved in cell wall biosynthesis
MSKISSSTKKIHIVGSNPGSGGVYTFILNIFNTDDDNIFIYRYRDFSYFFNNLKIGDVVFLNVVKPSLPFLFIALLFGKNKLKLIYCGHGMNYKNNIGLKRFIVRIFERLIVKLVDKVIVLNETDMVENLSINLNSHYLPTYLKPIGLNYNKNPIKNQLNWIAVGSVEERKDPYEFIKIANKILKNHPSDTFTWIGDGPLFNQIQSENLDVRIKFIGKINNIKLRKTLVSSDVFLCTSNFEVLPISILEAVEAGLILVVKNYHYSDEITKMFKSSYIYKTVEQILELRNNINKLQLLREFSSEEAGNVNVRYEKYKNQITNILYND